jgi:hypothetical protein
VTFAKREKRKEIKNREGFGVAYYRNYFILNKPENKSI